MLCGSETPRRRQEEAQLQVEEIEHLELLVGSDQDGWDEEQQLVRCSDRGQDRVRRSGHQQGGAEGRRTLLRWEQPGGRAKRRCAVCLGVGEEEAADWFRWRQVIG